jgi:multidrug efflux system outer membrane protein
MKSRRLAWALSLPLIASTALAQQQPPAAPPREPAAPPAPAPAQPAPAPVGPTGPVPAPSEIPATAGEINLPNVDDPMLGPVAPPQNVLTSWRQALTLVRQNSTTLKNAAARVQQAEAVARQTLSASLPSLTGNASVNYHILKGEGVVGLTDAGAPITGTIPDPATTWQAGLSLRVPVFAPVAWYDHGTAKRNIEVEKLSNKELERQILGSLANSIIATITAERLAEVSRVSLKSALSTLDLNQRRSALGASSALDVLRVEEEVQRARAQVIDADEAVRRARESLGLALGRSENYGVVPDIKLDELASDARASCRQEASVDQRPDIRAAQAEVEVAERRAKGVDWSYWPTVEAVSNLTYFSNENATANGKHLTWTVGGVLTWTLYDGGFRYGTREVYESNLAISKQNLTEAKRQAQIEVAQATRAVQVAEANLAVSAKARDISAETARLSRVAYLNGSGTSFDLVDTARRLREAEIDLAIKEFEVMRAKIAALLALASCDV